MAAATRQLTAAGRVVSLYRYPVKGLSADPLDDVELTVDRGMPYDRAFALTHTSAGASASGKVENLAGLPRLARLRTAFDEATTTLTVYRDERRVAAGNLATPLGRQLLEQFFAAWLGDPASRTPHIAASSGSFGDVGGGVVSLINLASVRDLERVMRRPVAPLRFRGNLYLDDVAAWQEFDWLGRDLAVGAVRLRVIERIGRCNVTNIDPGSGETDMNIPLALMSGFRHGDFGVYARVVTGGRVAVGDAIEI